MGECLFPDFLCVSLSRPLPGGKVPLNGGVPAEDHSSHREDVLLHRPGHEDTTAAAGTAYPFTPSTAKQGRPNYPRG